LGRLDENAIPDEMKAYGSLTTLEPSRVFMTGVIEQVSNQVAD
jgi:hypothetical protein